MPNPLCQRPLGIFSHDFNFFYRQFRLTPFVCTAQYLAASAYVEHCHSLGFLGFPVVPLDYGADFNFLIRLHSNGFMVRLGGLWLRFRLLVDF